MANVLPRICGFAGLSVAGSSAQECANFYQRAVPAFVPMQLDEHEYLVAGIGHRAFLSEALHTRDDRVVHFALHVAAKAYVESGWNASAGKTLVSIGSARGASATLEDQFRAFSEKRKVSAHASPTTTAGTISSSVARVIGGDSFEVATSMTCTSGFHSLLVGVAMMRAGFCDRALVGGSEAPLTPFILAQFSAMNLLCLKQHTSQYPCRPCNLEEPRANALVLGEGACVAAVDLAEPRTGDFYILAIGMGSECEGRSGAGIHPEGKAFQQAMRHALSQIDEEREIDAILMHAPGTKLGDRAEEHAIEAIFGSKIPFCYTNKYLIGHTLGASGMLSLELALLLLKGLRIKPFPYPTRFVTPPPAVSNTILVNSIGFGGMAISVIVGKMS